jgi:5-formyltetrahydrofolate cyclo-ligase
MLKSELRKYYLSKRLAISVEEFAEKNLELTNELFARIVELDIKDVFLFLPITKNNEFDCRLLVDRLWDVNVNTYLPVTDFDNQSMIFSRYDRGTELVLKNYGIVEPKNPIVADVEKAIVVTPLLITDKELNRVGYGGGFYDRFFSQTEGLYKIGVSFFEPIAEITDVDEFDVKLDENIVT